MKPANPYQLLDPLSTEERAALKADIAARGVLIPAEEDEEGNTLDGHHRKEIAAELGIKCPVVVRRFRTEQEKREHVLRINLARRHLDGWRWGQAFNRLLNERGIRTQRGPKPDDAISATVAEIASELGVPLRTAERRLAEAREFESLPASLQSDVRDKKTTLKKAVKRTRKAKKKKARERLAKKAAALPPGDRLLVMTADFRTADVPDASADWLVTDPPYPKEFVGLYRDLGAFASRVLKPGGSVLCMVGQSYLPDVLSLLCESLTYRWTLAYLTPGGQAVQCWGRTVNTFWKPVLWLTNGPWSGDWVSDVCKSATNDNDKEHHHWGQSESGMADLMKRFVKPGQRVCDPFLGGGTTGVVAVRLGCLFTGIETDPDMAATATARVAREFNQ